MLILTEKLKLEIMFVDNILVRVVWVVVGLELSETLLKAVDTF
jgi:hypothetical protein